MALMKKIEPVVTEKCEFENREKINKHFFLFLTTAL